MVGKIPENLFWIVADIFRHVPSKVPDIDCSWHFMVLYLGKVLIMFLVCYYFFWQKFVESSCLWLDHSDSEAFIHGEFFLPFLFSLPGISHGLQKRIALSTGYQRPARSLQRSLLLRSPLVRRSAQRADILSLMYVTGVEYFQNRHAISEQGQNANVEDNDRTVCTVKIVM